jgi:hypothetical protein
VRQAGFELKRVDVAPRFVRHFRELLSGSLRMRWSVFALVALSITAADFWGAADPLPRYRNPGWDLSVKHRDRFSPSPSPSPLVSARLADREVR